MSSSTVVFLLLCCTSLSASFSICGDRRLFFECRCDHKCIDISKVCDRIVDCRDRSDEANCKRGKHSNRSGARPLCSEHEFQCINATWCILSQFRCDGYVDCPDYSDEYNCTKMNRSRAPGLPFHRTLSYAVPPLLLIVIIFFCHQASRRRSAGPWLLPQRHGDVQVTAVVTPCGQEENTTDIQTPEAGEGEDQWRPVESPVTTLILPPKYEEALSGQLYDLPASGTPAEPPPAYEFPQTGALPPAAPPDYHTVDQGHVGQGDGQTDIEGAESQSTPSHQVQTPLMQGHNTQGHSPGD